MLFPTTYNSTSIDIAKVKEGNSCVLRFTLDDEGDPIPDTAISSAYLTLIDAMTGDIINNRDYLDVSSYIDGSGVFTFNLTGDDNIIWNEGAQPEELHIVIFEATALSGVNSLSLKEEIGIIVQNLPHYVRHVDETSIVTINVRLLWHLQ